VRQSRAGRTASAGARMTEASGADHDRGRSPQDRGNHAERISQQRAARCGEPVAECKADPPECAQYACPLQRTQPLTGHEPVQTQGGQAGREIDEHHHPRSTGVSQPGENEQELTGEQCAGGKARPERAVAPEQRDPRIRAQASRQAAAMAERTPPCITSDMSGAAAWLRRD